MFYYLYQVKNLLDNKIYVGVHQTNHLDDGYMGSGKVIRSAIHKHGIENFTKDILEFFDTSEAMYAKEAEIVTLEFLKRPDVYNICCGGSGGWGYLNSNSELQRKKSIKGNAKMKQLRETDEAWKQKKHDSHSKTLIKDYKEGTRVVPEAFRLSFLGKTHTQETKDKIGRINSENQSGTKNSRFGSVWVYSDLLKKSKSISKELVSTLGSDWKLGRKMKFNILFV